MKDKTYDLTRKALSHNLGEMLQARSTTPNLVTEKRLDILRRCVYFDDL